jgi:predicted nucleic acid-binding protein
LSELKEVLNRPFINKYLTTDQHKFCLQQIVDKAVIVDYFPVLGVDCRGEKDIKFLEVAISYKMECVVSGDKDLLILHPFPGIPIMTSSDFLKSLKVAETHSKFKSFPQPCSKNQTFQNHFHKSQMEGGVSGDTHTGTHVG